MKKKRTRKKKAPVKPRPNATTERYAKLADELTEVLDKATLHRAATEAALGTKRVPEGIWQLLVLHETLAAGMAAFRPNPHNRKRCRNVLTLREFDRAVVQSRELEAQFRDRHTLFEKFRPLLTAKSK